jgi:hypothetical protein
VLTIVGFCILNDANLLSTITLIPILPSLSPREATSSDILIPWICDQRPSGQQWEPSSTTSPRRCYAHVQQLIPLLRYCYHSIVLNENK